MERISKVVQNLLETFTLATLPYLTSPGGLAKAFNAIQSAATPPKVSGDFVKTVLGIRGGSGDNMTTFLKRIGFASSDGLPTEIYRKFRNQQTSGAAVAEAMRSAYSEIFRRNEFANLLSDEELKGHIVEITGSAADARNVTLTLSTFNNMKEFADFSAQEAVDQLAGDDGNTVESVRDQIRDSLPEPQNKQRSEALGSNIGYTINLNLPATSDIAVFNAIFKSLKEHLLT